MRKLRYCVTHADLGLADHTGSPFGQLSCLLPAGIRNGNMEAKPLKV